MKLQLPVCTLLKRKTACLLKVVFAKSPLIDKNADKKSLEDFIQGLLYPRDPGSEGSKKAQAFITEHYENIQWQVETDAFVEDTVRGKIHFANIIARFRPECARQIVLACHYDSRLKPSGFLGATDSAVPCAIIMDIAQYLSQANLAKSPQQSCLGLTQVFFDGEEAFVAFDSTDGLYGSRHLASKWDNATYFP